MDNLTKNKYMTVKEVADTLEVSERTIQIAVKKLANVLTPVLKNNQGGYLFTEEQVTLIKKEIQKHHNLQNRTIDNVTTSMEMKQKAIEIIKEQEVLGKNFKIYGTADEPLFLAKDVAEWIDYAFKDSRKIHRDVSKMLSTVDDEEKTKSRLKLGGENYSHGGVRENTEMWFLTEDGLYEVLMQSRKPIAKEFKKQVKIILKDVRRHGLYAKDELLDNPDLLLEIITKLKEERERNRELSQRAEEAEKKNHILMHTKKTYTTTEIAKEMGMRSAMELNQKLSDMKIQFKQNDTWILYSQYSDMSLVSIKQEIMESGRIIYHRRWTDYGRAFILDKVGGKNGTI